MSLPINETHKNNNQFPFKNHNSLKLESFVLHRDNKFTKEMINNRHEIVMTKYNNAGYGYQIFSGQKNIGSIWLLNQVNSKTTYVRVSRYESYASGYFIAVLSELSDLLERNGYSLLLKTKIGFAQNILNKNFYSMESKKTTNKRGKNDRSKKSVSVDGITYYIHLRNHNYDKWHNENGILDA
ncbi:MAG: hypothetical protein RR533_00610 [Carnobacterium sp.]